MKIIQIVTQMEAAGAQRVAYILHDSLRRRGHATELWFLYLKRPAYTDKPGVRELPPFSVPIIMWVPGLGLVFSPGRLGGEPPRRL